MDRRDFISSAGLMLAGTTIQARAETKPFDPTEQSIAALQQALASGALTSEALTEAYLSRIARFDHHGPEYRAILALNPDALAAAHALDAEHKAGKLRGPLHGIPIVIKDNIETKDPLSTTAGSLALARSRRPTDAPLVARLRAAGVIVLGKANLSEWANFRSTH